jgi:dUTP pyrophosphatase
MGIKVKFRRLHKEFKLPVKAHKTDAGLDFVYPGDSNIAIPPRSRAKVPLGFAIELPENYELQIRPRSGLALNKGITILNSPGTVDAGYRDEVAAIIYNSEDTTFIVLPGMKICQGVVTQLPEIETELVEELAQSERSGGFGSTGS